MRTAIFMKTISSTYKKITATATAALIALGASGCAVEVPMSAFRLTPPDAAKADQEAPQGAPRGTQGRVDR